MLKILTCVDEVNVYIRVQSNWCFGQFPCLLLFQTSNNWSQKRYCLSVPFPAPHEKYAHPSEWQSCLIFVARLPPQTPTPDECCSKVGPALNGSCHLPLFYLFYLFILVISVNNCFYTKPFLTCLPLKIVWPFKTGFSVLNIVVVSSIELLPYVGTK